MERLDGEWTEILNRLKNGYSTADFKGFDDYMKERQTEYEQLAVYFIYRHFANAFDFAEASLTAKFTALGVMIIYLIGAVIFTEIGSFDFESQINVARLFSSEIEYSDQNLDIILSELEE